MSQQALTSDTAARRLALRLAVATLGQWTDRARRAAAQRPPDRVRRHTEVLAPADPARRSPQAVPVADAARKPAHAARHSAGDRPAEATGGGRPADGTRRPSAHAGSASSTPPTVSAEHPGDPGVPVLARLVAAMGDAEAAAVAARAAAVWARDAGRGPGHRGLFDGGLAGTLVGLRQCAVLHPALHPVADRLRDRLLDHPARPFAGGEAEPPGRPRGAPERYGAVTFPDYDLIVGPSGVLLALTADGHEARGTPGEAESGPAAYAAYVSSAARLAALCDGAELPGLRTHYPAHPLLGWLHGRINTGMGHGVAGVTAALTAAVRQVGPRPELAAALRNTSRWLMKESFDDARDIRTWTGCGLDGQARPPGAHARQAWCYGTPGVSWALWDAADALGDPVGAAWAAAAFRTLADGYHEGFHLFGDHPGDRLGLCHGAAGVLAVADAMRRHGRLPAAAALRERLLGHFVAQEDELWSLAGERCGLLGGAGGALAAVLTATGGNRGWLPCAGLR
ncbi:lanthionine synthetase LanC family protein [Streptomyces diacarni]|uniref:lanthionine synthetase LanC family protein n=1 Tax=Streptomyces diacarni TaxID=2800381 RepID=UPI0033CA6EDE